MEFPDKPVAQLLGASGPVHAVTYSASPGSYILTGSADRAIRLYNPASPPSGPGPAAASSGHIGSCPSSSSSSSSSTPAIPEGRLIQTYAAHGYEVLSLAVADDNARFASSGGDRGVFLWDVATAQTLRRFPGHDANRVHAVTFAGQGDDLVVSGGFDTTVRLWDARSGAPKPVQTLTDARDAVSCVAVSGPEVVAGSVDGRLRTWDVRAGRLTTDVVGASVTSLCLARDAKTALVGALDSALRLMDREHGTCLRTYRHPAWRNEELRVQAVLGANETFVVAGDEMTAPLPDDADADADADASRPSATANQGLVWAWNLLTGKLVAKVPVPWAPNAPASHKKVIGRDGKEKERRNVVSCLAWRDRGFGNQFCAGDSSGVVTVFGQAS